MSRTLESNIWKYTVHLITNKRTFLSIFGVYLLTLPGTTPQTLGFVLLVSYFAGFIFEIPSGYLADRIGHKTALVFGRACLLVSSTLYLVGASIPFFVLGGIFLSIGNAFQSGTTRAFMHETLRGLGREHEYSKIIGRVSSIGFIVPVALIMLIPFFVSISYKIPFAIAVFLDIVGLLVVATYAVPRNAQEKIKEIGFRNFSSVVSEGIRRGFFKYAIFAGVLAGTITGVSGFKDVYQAFLGVPVIYFGVFWGISRILVSGILLFNQKIKDLFSLRQFLFARLVLGAGLISSVGLFSSPYVVVSLFVLIAAFNWSVQETQNHYFLDMLGDSKSKATLLSVKTLVSALVSAGVAFAAGTIFTRAGYPVGFLSIAAGLLFVMGTYYLLFLNKERNGGRSFTER